MAMLMSGPGMRIWGLTIFHSGEDAIQSRKIAALSCCQYLNHLEDNRSLKLK